MKEEEALVGNVESEAFQAPCGNPRSVRISTGAAFSTARGGAIELGVVDDGKMKRRIVSATNQLRQPLDG